MAKPFFAKLDVPLVGLLGVHREFERRTILRFGT